MLQLNFLILLNFAQWLSHSKYSFPLNPLPAIQNTSNLLHKSIEKGFKQENQLTSLSIYSHGGELFLETNNEIIGLKCSIKNQIIVSKTVTEKELLSVGSAKSDNEGNRSTSHIGEFFGVVGFYQLPLGHYVGLMKEVRKVKNIGIDNVYKIIDWELIKIPNNEEKNKTSENSLLTLTLTNEQKEAEQLLKQTFSRHQLFFLADQSNYDITHSFQSNSLHKIEKDDIFRWKNSDKRFFWNYNSIKPLIAAELRSLIVPITNAWISSSNFSYHGVDYLLTFISRRSCRRQGPRFIKRGGNEMGEVANFVETEQILQRLDGKGNSSFIQIRGSIPLRWKQPNIWQLRPSIKIADNVTDHLQVLRHHLIELLNLYVHPFHNPEDVEQKMISHPSVYMINLIDKHGNQGKLGRFLFQILSNLSNSSEKRDLSENDLDNRSVLSHADFSINSIPSFNKKSDELIQYEDIISQYFDPLEKNDAKNPSNSVMESTVRLIWYDFHCKSKKGKLESMEEVYSLLKGRLDQAVGNVFTSRYDEDGQDSKRIESIQNYIVRTNCIDCLDRTNVMQTVVSRWYLVHQLNQLTAVDAMLSNYSTVMLQSNVLEFPVKDIEDIIRKTWAENGDYLSMLYAGTHALKRDVTRYGKRTRKGVIADGMNSVKRYFINNYDDQRRQAGLDLLLGKKEKVADRRISLQDDLINQFFENMTVEDTERFYDRTEQKSIELGLNVSIEEDEVETFSMISDELVTKDFDISDDDQDDGNDVDVDDDVDDTDQETPISFTNRIENWDETYTLQQNLENQRILNEDFDKIRNRKLVSNVGGGEHSTHYEDFSTNDRTEIDQLIAKYLNSDEIITQQEFTDYFDTLLNLEQAHIDNIQSEVKSIIKKQIKSNKKESVKKESTSKRNHSKLNNTNQTNLDSNQNQTRHLQIFPESSINKKVSKVYMSGFFKNIMSQLRLNFIRFLPLIFISLCMIFLRRVLV